jgi:hypothetical protein
MGGHSYECVWDPRNKYKPGIDVYYFNKEDMMSLVIQFKKYQVLGTKEQLITYPSSILERLTLLITSQVKNLASYHYTLSLEDESFRQL